MHSTRHASAPTAWLWLKNLLFTALVPATVAVYLPLVLSRHDPAAAPVRMIIASVLFGAGATVYAWTVSNFAVHGRGTPAPIDAPRVLVVTGPYRRVRNPMYLGVLSVLAGWVCLSGKPLIGYVVGVAVAFHLMVVAYEEPHLRRQFPLDYPSYCARVPRWLPRWQRTA